MVSSLATLDTKAPEATVLAPFNFASLISGTQTIVSAAATATVWAGNDPNPGAILGAVTFTTPLVSVTVQGGIAGTIYKIRTSAGLSDGTIQILFGYLAVIEDPV